MRRSARAARDGGVARRRRARRSRDPGAPHKARSGRAYVPMRVDRMAARRGITARLLAATGCALVTTLCVLWASAGAPTLFGLLALCAISTGSLALACSLLLSARREEVVHQLAASLHEAPPRALEGPSTDGSIGPRRS